MEGSGEFIEKFIEKPPVHDHQPRLNEVAQKFLADLDEERQRLSAEFPLCALLIDEAVDRVYCTGRIPGKEFYADVYKQKPMKITQKVFVPVKQYPKFNFTGKILGPKGNSLRRLQEETQCKIAIKGRSSIRDRNKEEQLRNSGDPRYSHLQKDLFLEVSTVATPAECYARIAYALAEIRKYLIPDKNDEVSHEQLRELMEMDPESAKSIHGPNLEAYRSVFDKKFGAGSSSAPKYINLIKRAAENPPEAEEAEEAVYAYEHPHRMPPKRGPPTGYEYSKPRPSIIPTNAAAYKRPQPYPTDMKRMREPPIKSYKPNTYTILKKYK
ncbi:KH domain-containing, RNA-binding, signal transduction-associated protein 2 isoform X1 [Drosophila miranda]|uniref:KH domain-containing, RNA-binding, signal transduction-associated protein 2 n=1 Tax=Drosophila pseudoobscura pseudoobscura TaxID=46245 RepID=A0A6I8UWC3_DROPS|nr:KH domain-containing, RNA-binding, signal transduction-associated protein 2 [Drosophila pseudoobscura]XP_017148699.1 KH domain-containing, RNA-binding, signal transduction-associated protein 2 isoform X1 [Drosophila miranda]XP_026841348.1 KH domain-containing, RNA-binding, signal transduction-associated protein 2 [Drosophila persimilis]